MIDNTNSMQIKSIYSNIYLLSYKFYFFFRISTFKGEAHVTTEDYVKFRSIISPSYFFCFQAG